MDQGGDKMDRSCSPPRGRNWFGEYLACYIGCHSLPSADSRRAVVHFLLKYVHKYRLIA